jgi:hypothetical protein
LCLIGSKLGTYIGLLRTALQVALVETRNFVQFVKQGFVLPNRPSARE